MSAGTVTAGSARLRRWAAGGALIWVAANLGPLAPQAAVAQAQGALIAAGNAHSCAIEYGKAYCWGENDFGQLGDGSTTDSSVPVAVDTSGVLHGKTLTQISAGGGGGIDTCALDSTGTAFCWGSNIDGGLGDGGIADSSVPVAVDTGGVLRGKTLTQITAGSDGGCVLDSAGAAYCWGDNDYGELGDGGTADSSVPVAVDTSGALAGKALTQITGGYEDTCGLASSGVAYCWGDNSSWELGDGSGGTDGDYSSVPVAVDTKGALARQSLTQISAGWLFACAVDAAGAAYCWGEGDLGSDLASSSVPVAVDTSGVLAGHKVSQISAGLGEACALDAAGAAFCWGDADYGELGDGIFSSSSVPVAVDTRGVLARKTLTQVSAGAFHVCALDAVGAAYCWGDNNQGDLGNDGTTASDVPVLAGPHAPSGVTALPGDTTATVSWAAPASLDGGTLIGYTATALPGGSACTTTSTTTCVVTGLTDGITYSISVVARTTAGDSGASAPATVTPGHTGPIISGLRATRCVDDLADSTKNDTPVVMWDCNGRPEQSWTIETNGTIQVNGKCLDIYRQETKNKAAIELWTCHGAPNQQWHALGRTLVNPHSGKCLDDPRWNTTNGTQLEIYTCDGSPNQKWILP